MLYTLWKAHYLLATKSPTPLSIAPGARKSQQQQPAFLTGPTFLIPWLSWQDLIKEAILRRGVYLRRAKALEGKRKATTTLTPLLGQRLGNKGRLTSVGTSWSITHPPTSIVTPPPHPFTLCCSFLTAALRAHPNLALRLASSWANEDTSWPEVLLGYSLDDLSPISLNHFLFGFQESHATRNCWFGN